MADDTKRQKHWLGVDLGGTKILAAVFDDNLQSLGRAKAEVRASEGADAVIDRIVECAHEAAAKADVGWKQIQGVGVGAPSPIDDRTGRVIYAPNLDWTDLPLQDILRKRLNAPVFVGNDCNLATLGVHEVEFGAKPRNLLAIYPGTGIGGGLIIDGRLVNGFNGGAGEFGHMTLHYGGPSGVDKIPGSLESVAGRAAIAARIRRDVANGQNTLLTKLLRKAIARGDTYVECVIREASGWVGAAIASLINVVNPEIVVVGGGMIEQMEDLILPILRAKAKEYTHAGVRKGIDIVASKLADDAGIVGAAVFARRAGAGK
jgi:glucokinase